MVQSLPIVIRKFIPAITYKKIKKRISKENTSHACLFPLRIKIKKTNLRNVKFTNLLKVAKVSAKFN